MTTNTKPVPSAQESGRKSPVGPDQAFDEDRRQVVIDLLASAFFDLLLRDQADNRELDNAPTH